MPKKTQNAQNAQNTQYTFTLLFPRGIKRSQVTKVDFQVIGDPAIIPPLPRNKMPAKFAVNDTITFTYQQANKDLKINSCLFTQFNITSSTKGGTEDFITHFDQPIPITDDYRGSWIFHLLGLYKYKGKRAAYYLDPEFTCGPY